MPPKVQKSKAAKMLAATSAAKGKGKKKKWSKGKLREKRDNRVIFNKATYEKIMKEVPKKMKVITVYNLIENYKINGSLARKAIGLLLEKGEIQVICPGTVYTSTSVAAKK